MNATLHARLEAASAAAVRLRRAFDARARRERILLIGAAVAVVVMLGDTLWLTPAFEQWNTARRRAALAATALRTMNDDLAQRGAQARAFEQQVQREVAQWRDRVRQGDAELRGLGTSLVPAAEMLPVLEHMLAQSGGLKVRSMQSLPRTELATAAVGAPAAVPAASAPAPAQAPVAGPALYRHGVELTVEGSYADLLAYLQALEAMPQRLLWGGVQLKVDEYPKALLTLRLYTLSMDRGWLEI